MNHAMLASLVLVLVLAFAPRADAYPQYTLSHDVTCTGCHLAPDGSGILSENGVATAEQVAWHPGDGNFMYGMTRPSWLELGGDVRLAAGYVRPGIDSAAGYPMQAELAASVHFGAFAVHATGGLRRPADNGSALHVLFAREYYLMWQQHPGETEGLYVRAGRLMPTFGLRLAEHVVYTQRFGGFPLYGEAYALAVSYVKSAFEIHATGFIHDPIAIVVERGDGGALYAEKRLGDHAAVGVEGKYSSATDQKQLFGGLTGKLYLEGPKLLFQAEAEVIHTNVTAASDSFNSLAGYLLGTRELGGGFMLDVGVGHYTQDTRVQGLYRDAVDANLHWFMTSHVEWLLTTRLEAAPVRKAVCSRSRSIASSAAPRVSRADSTTRPSSRSSSAGVAARPASRRTCWSVATAA